MPSNPTTSAMLTVCIPFLPWVGRADLEIQIPSDTEERFQLRAAVEIAVTKRESLDHASLDYARLDYASLDYARLDGASLDYARLDGASLVGASLVGASLDHASLDGASLDGARLDHARLVGARLDGASLVGASLDPIRNDLWDVLLRAQPEVPALLAAVRAGQIDGRTYTGKCACLAGTIAKARGVNCEDLGFADSSRPIERWFLGIRQGDTPESNHIARITEGWIVEFLALTGRED